MNGYSEHAATWGLGSYLVASLSACCLAAFMAVNLSRIYLQRPTSTGAGIFLSISISTSIGIAITVVSSFIAIAVAEYARTHR
jgi:hypothetical protein